MTTKPHKIDEIDLQILKELTLDARVAFSDLAKKLGIANGTVHLRVEKMKESGIIKRSKFVIDYSKLGMQVEAFVGVSRDTSQSEEHIVSEINKLDEICESIELTGKYYVMVRVLAESVEHLRACVKKIQSISGVTETETLVILSRTFERDPVLKVQK